MTVAYIGKTESEKDSNGEEGKGMTEKIREIREERREGEKEDEGVMRRSE